jgi:large subunit ribosomal protein L18
MQIDKGVCNERRKRRVRKCITGTAGRPRSSVKFSRKYIDVPRGNNEIGNALEFLSTLAQEAKAQKLIANVAGAASLSQISEEKAISSGIKQAAFDRGGRKNHDCVQSFADAAREAGLLFHGGFQNERFEKNQKRTSVIFARSRKVMPVVLRKLAMKNFGKQSFM